VRYLNRTYRLLPTTFKILFLSFHRRAIFNYRIFDAEYFATLNSRFGDVSVRARCSTVMSFHQKAFQLNHFQRNQNGAYA